MEKPQIVGPDEWQKSREELLVAEKEATRALDALAARRRRLPMTPFGTGYTFDTSDGPRPFLDLFDGRDELVVYQFMDNGPDDFCPGCTWFTDNVPITALKQLADRGITWATISDMPLAQIEGYKAERGWTLPFHSSHGTTFAKDSGTRDSGGFQLTAFLRDGDEVFKTWSTTARGVDRLNFSSNIMDITAYGRMQEWEDSPAGWPQQPTYG